MKVSSSVNSLTKFNKEGEFAECIIFKWNCPLCANDFYGEYEDKHEFVEALIVNEGMRHVKSKNVQGFFCGDCIEKGDLDNASL